MTYDDAVGEVRDALAHLQFGAARARAIRAFARLAYNLAASEESIRQWHEQLTATIPQFKPALDRILAERAQPVRLAAHADGR
jgi:hypothetical protein